MSNSEKIQIYVYKCNTCGKLYSSEAIADICCKEYVCDTCGAKTPKYFTRCQSCREKLQYDKAIKMTWDEYYAKHPNNLIWYSDNYYYDIDDLITQFDDMDINDRPKYCYGTYEIKIQLTNDILIHLEEDSDCDDDNRFTDEAYNEFYRFALDWNDKHSYSVYSTDYNIIILLNDDMWE